MTTRFKAGDPRGVPSGYEGNVSPDISIPSCGIEDVDRALFVTLRDEVAFQVSENGGGNQKAVPMVFAVGEKWSMIKSGRAIRDRDGTLILPLVTMRRTSIEQTSNDMVSRGMNQHVGSMVVKTKLEPADRNYQNLINKLGLPNSDDVAGPRESQSDGLLLTDRDNTMANANDLEMRDGALLAPKLGVNAWQIISIPTPQFYTATYEITMWAQYMEHMNSMLEKLMSSYLPTGNRTLKLNTPAGYWFIANFDEGYPSEDNSDSATGVELIRKMKFNVKVPAYVVLSSAPGVPSGIKKYVSAPQITFAIGGEDQDSGLVDGIPSSSDPYQGADDPPQLFLDPGVPSGFSNQSSERVEVDRILNPFTGKTQPRYVRVVDRNISTGETVFVPDEGIGLRILSKK